MAVYINNKSGKRYLATAMGRINTTNAQDGQIMVDYEDIPFVRKTYTREISEFRVKFTKESSIGQPWKEGGMD